MQDSAAQLLDLPAPLAELDDRALVDAVAKAITPPKVKASSSFVLHAPMELIARARLLGLAPPEARPEGRRRIADIATRYAGSGPEAGPVARSYADQAAALEALTAAIPAGDVDEADGALGWLLERSSVATLLPLLADTVIPALGAAGHAPILLSMFLRSPELGERYGALLRAPLRYLTQQGCSRLTWQTSTARTGEPATGGLAGALLSPPHVDSPSTSIAPTMLSVEAGGFAQRLLASPTRDIALEETERTLLRIAARSMLHDDPAHAPYGWSHCLTMPQGVLTLAAVAGDRRAAIRVAATHVLGFRATLAKANLNPDQSLPRPASTVPTGVSPEEAASVVYCAAPEDAASMRDALVARAVAHHDAHLAKYTLACLDAAARDPEGGPLYLAAAAYLGAWWDANPGAGFGG
jgi:hypothetical protein